MVERYLFQQHDPIQSEQNPVKVHSAILSWNGKVVGVETQKGKLCRLKTVHIKFVKKTFHLDLDRRAGDTFARTIQLKIGQNYGVLICLRPVRAVSHLHSL